MKKFLDRFVFRKAGLQVLLSVGIIILFSIIANICRDQFVGLGEEGPVQHALWGFKQVSSPAMAIRAIEAVDTIVADNPANRGAGGILLFISLGAWLVGLVVYSFVTGSIVNAFRNRKKKIDSGQVRYRFRNHGIVIGWNFQGMACVKELLRDCDEVLVVAGVASEQLRDELGRDLDNARMSRVFIYYGRIGFDESLLRDCWPEHSRKIIILGERGGDDNNGGTIHLERLIRQHIERSTRTSSKARLPIAEFLHIENPVLHAQALTVPRDGFAENDNRINLEPFNYCESWAWRCWSAKGAHDGSLERPGDAYLPLKHRADAERVELFILGANPMGQAMTRFAMPLLNYGFDERHCRITLFDANFKGRACLPERRILDALPETEAVFRSISGDSDEANDLMIAAAADPKTAVTIVIATSGADAAVQSYLTLPNALRRLDVSVLLWQPTPLEKCPSKVFLQTGGDRVKLRFFGMTDVLPWMDSTRQLGGSAVNYFYDVIFNRDKVCNTWNDPALPQIELPPMENDNLLDVAKTIWDRDLALQRWLGVERWKRWSSVNCADAFRERAAAFPSFMTDVSIRE